MKKLFILVGVYALLSPCVAQIFNGDVWMLGYGNAFNFGLKQMTVRFPGDSIAEVDTCTRVMNFSETMGTICNAKGEVLFSCNGVFIANAEGDTMANGAGFNPGDLTNQSPEMGLNLPSALAILPDPADSSLFHLFHQTMDYMNFGTAGYSTKLYHTVVDMKLSGQKGGVSVKNEILIADTLNPNVIPIKHANGRDWWVVVKVPFREELYSVLLSPDGVGLPSFQQLPDGGVQCDYFWNSAPSPDGTKFAGYNPHYGVWLYDFDRCAGTIEKLTILQVPEINNVFTLGGVAFSPSSRYLYVSCTDSLFQYDTWAADVAGSRQLIATYDGFQNTGDCWFGIPCLAPTNEILVGSDWFCRSMGVIHHPDSFGQACGFVQHEFHLPAMNKRTVPNYTNYRLGALAGSGCDTLASVQAAVAVGGLRLYPNPSTGILNIVFPLGFKGDIRLMDNLGNTLKEERLETETHELAWDLRGLSTGVYYVRAGAAYQKVIIQ